MYPSIDNNLSNEKKIKIIQDSFTIIMQTLWLDLTDDSLKKTPYRVAKMYVNEVFKWLDKNEKPNISCFENKYNYDEIVIVKDIKVFSFCEHHLLPFIWKAFVWYIPNWKVIGLSKISRIVDYYSRKPQVQERLTEEIYCELKKVLDTDSICIVIKASHHCMIIRWIEDINSSTITSKAEWTFKTDPKTRDEFMKLINL